MDWSKLSILERLGMCTLAWVIVVGGIYITYILDKAIWRNYLRKHERTEPAIEKPERIKVDAYDRKGNLIWWERRKER